MPIHNSPNPGPARGGAQHLVGDALYSWCRNEQDFGYVFVQDELLASNIIPNRDLNILLSATQYLVSKHLLKLHDIKGQEGIGWELVSPDIAKSYDGLTSDEQMVYASIAAAGTQGIWTKTIKAKSGVHAKVLDRVYKSLESRQLIKQMKSVKNPGRKMYILYGMQPSEEATGGAWFTEGRLDIEMIDAISQFVEYHCSRQSWREVSEDDSDFEMSPNNKKRKRTDDDVDGNMKGKNKTTKGDVEALEVGNKAKKHPVFEPYEPGYTNYPTIREISKALIERQVIESGQVLPDNALAQLLDVMVYDDRLYKMDRKCRAGEQPDVVKGDDKTVTMYRCFKTPVELSRLKHQRDKIAHGSKTAARQVELEDIGRGGSSEVPCLGCPNFDICGVGGQINAETCTYFDQWFKRMEEADREVDDPWPSLNIRSNKVPSSDIRR